MRRFNLFLWILPSLIGFPVFSFPVNKSTVLVCYGKLDATKIKGYNYVILEEKHFKKEEITIIKKNNKNVLAYISLGEVNSNASHYNLLKDNTLGKNTNWNSHYLDLKSDKTTLVLMRLIKKNLDKGFDGLFLDNIDNYSSFGPQKNQRKELIELIKKIKKQYPNHLLIQNSGAELIEDTNKYVDAILFESVATNFSFKDNVYKLREIKEYTAYLDRLKAIHSKYKLPVILVEYADNQKLYTEVINRLATTNFEYFIGKIDLQSIPSFTKTIK
jgi:uncharacterized protein (TIGR01370 family)